MTESLRHVKDCTYIHKYKEKRQKNSKIIKYNKQ